MNLPGNSRIYHGGGAGRRGFSSSGSSVSVVNTQKITVSHLDLQVPAPNNLIVLSALPAGAILAFSRMKPDVVFSGGTITDYYLSIGIMGATEDVLAEYNVATVLPGNMEYAEAFCPMSFDYNTPVNLFVFARSVGDDLSASATGQVTIELYYFSKVV